MTEIPQAGLIGYPLTHSLSSHLHGAWLDRYQARGAYHLAPLEGLELEPFFAAFRAGKPYKDYNLGAWAGFNITLPYKAKAAALCDKLTEGAGRIGAVNMVTRLEDGSLEGDNSDYYGYCADVRQHPIFDQLDPKHEAALMIGAGGAARAILAGLIDLGFGLTIITNRSYEKAKSLAEDLAATKLDTAPHRGIIHTMEWDQAMAQLDRFHYIVNCTQLGMEGQPILPIDLTKASRLRLAHDIVYRPLETQFLQKAKQAGAQTLDGLGMLMRQGQPGFSRWFGKAAGLKAGEYPVIDQDFRRHIEAKLTS